MSSTARPGATFVLVTALAVLGTVVTVLLVTQSLMIGAGALALMLLPAGAMLSGNPRLFLLWGVLLTAPLAIRKHFAIRPLEGGEYAFKLTATDVFLIPLILFLLYDLLAGGRRLRVPKVTWFYVGAIVLGLLSVPAAHSKLSAAHEIVRMSKVLLIFLVVLNHLHRYGQFKHVALAIVAGILLQLPFGFMQMFLKMHLGLEKIGETVSDVTKELATESVATQRVRRVGALAGHPNKLAELLAKSLPVAFALLFTRVSMGLKTVAVIALVGGQVLLLGTLSRSGWITTAFALLFVFVFTFYHRRMRHRFVVPKGLIVGALVVVVLVFAKPVMTRIFRADPSAVSIRFELMGVAWKMVKAQPLLGHGINQWTFEMAPYTRFGTLEGVYYTWGESIPVVHNVYLLWWLEQGTLGLILHLVVIGLIVRTGWRNMRIEDEFLYAMNVAFLAGFLASCIDGLASWGLRMNTALQPWWIYAAVIYALRYWHWREEELPAAGERPPRGRSHVMPLSVADTPAARRPRGRALAP